MTKDITKQGPSQLGWTPRAVTSGPSRTARLIARAMDLPADLVENVINAMPQAEVELSSGDTDAE